MKNRLFYFLIFILISGMGASAQEQEKGIVEIIDQLRMDWDSSSEKLTTYDGLKDYCRNRVFRDNTSLLLDQIHHYDTSLYRIVKTKFDVSADAEAKATLDDIKELESSYTTRSFLLFLRDECTKLNDTEMNKGSKKYKKSVSKIETELTKYVLEITELVDVIDEHVHHLSGL